MFFYKFPESDIRDIKHKPSSTSMSSTAESLTYLTAIYAVFYTFIKREPDFTTWHDTKWHKSFNSLYSKGVRCSDILLILVLKNPSPFPITIRLYLPVSQAFLISFISSDIILVNSSMSASVHCPGPGLLIEGNSPVSGLIVEYHL